jgi:choline kinase
VVSGRAPVHAAILAAGLSSRFGGLQKALHSVGGTTLLERSIRQLLAGGAVSVTVVTGHRRGEVEDALRECALDTEVGTLHNDRYSEWNNFYSVELACNRLPAGDVLVVNGDVVYCAQALRAVLAGRRADLYLAVSAEQVDDEAMKVEVDEQRVVGLGKWIPASRAAGEFVGISRLAPSARSWYASLSRWGRERGLVSHYYEDVYDGLCGNLVAVRCDVDPRDWAEIDEAADLARAQVVVDRDGDPASTDPSRADAPPA